MRKGCSFLLLTLFSATAVNAQTNVGIGTDNPAGKVHITGTENEPKLIINKPAAQVNSVPLFKMQNDAGDLLWLNTDHPSNIFLGEGAGRTNYVDQTTTGTRNIFIGQAAGTSHRFGTLNTAVGHNAMNLQLQGSFNTAIGGFSLLRNTSSYNTAVGFSTLQSSTTGNNNTAVGSDAARSLQGGSNNTTLGAYAMSNATAGGQNVATGYFALTGNRTGSYNTADGAVTLEFTQASNYNTAVGYGAGSGFNNGWNNVFVGANTDVNGAGYFNVIAIGQGTIVNASSTARFGNSATTSYGGWAGWTNISDGRFKTDVAQNVPGLSFITQLTPVTYRIKASNLDAYLHKNDTKKQEVPNPYHAKALQEKEAITYTGFIAQDVEAAAKSVNFNFSGVDKPSGNDDIYGLRYAEFVVPLVKAVQELKQKNDELTKQLEELKQLVESMKK